MLHAKLAFEPNKSFICNKNPLIVDPNEPKEPKMPKPQIHHELAHHFANKKQFVRL